MMRTAAQVWAGSPKPRTVCARITRMEAAPKRGYFDSDAQKQAPHTRLTAGALHPNSEGLTT